MPYGGLSVDLKSNLKGHLGKSVKIATECAVFHGAVALLVPELCADLPNGVEKAIFDL